MRGGVASAGRRFSARSRVNSQSPSPAGKSRDRNAALAWSPAKVVSLLSHSPHRPAQYERVWPRWKGSSMYGSPTSREKSPCRAPRDAQ
eukprot:scaffold13317_cov33-Tisochrysis_lutea.AAC.5